MSDKITMKKQKTHEGSKLIADWSAHWHIVRLEEFGVELDTIHCSPCVGTDLDQVVGSNVSANQCNSTEPAHWSAQTVELVVDQGDCIHQYQEMKIEIKAIQLKLNETKEKAMMDIGRAQAEVEHLKELLDLEQCTKNEMKGQLDSQAKQLVDNNILQLNFENAQEEIKNLKNRLQVEERARVDLKTQLELQGKLLEDQMKLQKRLEAFELEAYELKYRLEVEERSKIDLKSELKLQEKQLVDLKDSLKRSQSLVEELQYSLEVDKRSKADMKTEIDHQGKLLADQSILHKNYQAAQLEIKRLNHILEAEPCTQKNFMDDTDVRMNALTETDRKESFMDDTDIDMNEPKKLLIVPMDEKAQNKRSITDFRIFMDDITTNHKIQIYAAKVSLKLKLIPGFNASKEATMNGTKVSMKTTFKPFYRFDNDQQLIKKPLNNHFLNKKERNRRSYHTHMTNNISNTLKN